MTKKREERSGNDSGHGKSERSLEKSWIKSWEQDAGIEGHHLPLFDIKHWYDSSR